MSISKCSCLFVFILITHFSWAQASYVLETEVPVYTSEGQLSMPWAGGINSVQINMMDFTGDGRDDLVLFERTYNLIKPLEWTESGWKFRPDYIEYFPKVENWMLLRDYNGDGLKDIFTSHPLGIQVFVNSGDISGQLSWRKFNLGEEITTMGQNGPVNIAVNSDDVPAIDDIDGDGKLDILSFAFLANSVEFNKNISTGDTLAFEKVTINWGDFQECDCGVFAFGQGPCEFIGGRVEHANAKSLLSLDMDNDGDKDLVISEDQCSQMYYFENVGNNQDAILRNPTTNFPQSIDPVNLRFYPAAYIEDVDADGKKDLLVTTNVKFNAGLLMDFRSNVHYYKNIGTSEAPVYSLQTMSYLHDSMIDVGENSSPAFADIDNDGDQDMVVGQWGSIVGSSRKATLYLYENIGTPYDPVFLLKDTDWLTLSELNLFNIKPVFQDINGDQHLDLGFSATRSSQFDTGIYYLLNNTFWGFNAVNFHVINTGINMGLYENVSFHDVDHDLDGDILIGRSSGEVEFWENISTDAVPLFIKRGLFNDFEADVNRPYPVLRIADIDGNEVEDILLGARNGNFSIYPDYESTGPNSDSLPISLSYSSKELEDTKLLGSAIFPTTVTLFSDDLATIVLGNSQGGINLLRNENAIPRSSEEIAQVPSFLTDGTSEFNLSASRNIIVRYLTIKGQVVLPFQKIISGSSLTFPIRNLAPGMYIAQIYYDPDHFVVRKIMVAN